MDTYEELERDDYLDQNPDETIIVCPWCGDEGPTFAHEDCATEWDIDWDALGDPDWPEIKIDWDSDSEDERYAPADGDDDEKVS